VPRRCRDSLRLLSDPCLIGLKRRMRRTRTLLAGARGGLPLAARWRALVPRAGAGVVGLVAAAQRAAGRVLRDVISECLMVLSLPVACSLWERPGGSLADLSGRAPREPRLGELTELLARSSPHHRRARLRRARWSDLDQKMQWDRAPVPRLPPVPGARRAALLCRAGGKVQSRRGAGRRTLVA
jgi:hypothetical protein